MLNIDSAFDEKALGFKTFTAFVKAVEGVELIQDDKTWLAYLPESEATPEKAPERLRPSNHDTETLDTTEGYRRILRKKHWRSIPRPALIRCYTTMRDLGALPKSDLIEAVVSRSDGALTVTDLNKATQLLYKADLISVSSDNGDGEPLWTVSDVSETDMLHAVDRAMVARLAGGLEEIDATLAQAHVVPLLLGDYTEREVHALLEEAIALASAGSSGD